MFIYSLHFIFDKSMYWLNKKIKRKKKSKKTEIENFII